MRGCQKLFRKLPDETLTSQTKSKTPFITLQKDWQALVGESGPSSSALAFEDGEDFVWMWIGPHDEYERIIKQQS
jgi:hypothetical protein